MYIETNPIITDSLISKWNRFILQHPLSTIYQTPEYFRSSDNSLDTEGILVIAIENEEIIGLFISFIYKHQGPLKILTSRSISYGGPLAKDDDSNILSEVVQVHDNYIKRLVIYSQIRNMHSTNQSAILLDKFGYSYLEHLNIIIDTNQNKYALWKSFKPKLRQNIRKAEKLGMKFKESTDQKTLQISYSLIQLVYKKVKLPLPTYDFFESAYKNMMGSSCLKIFIAEIDGNVLSARIILQFKNTLYDWFAGSSNLGNKFNSNDFLIYNVLKWGIDNSQIEKFDFGGAGHPKKTYGVREHKKKFGGEIIAPGRLMKIYKPILYRIGKQGLKLYKLFL